MAGVLGDAGGGEVLLFRHWGSCGDSCWVWCSAARCRRVSVGWWRSVRIAAEQCVALRCICGAVRHFAVSVVLCGVLRCLALRSVEELHCIIAMLCHPLGAELPYGSVLGRCLLVLCACSALRCLAMRCLAVLRGSLRCSAAELFYGGALQCGALQCDALRCGALRCGAFRHGALGCGVLGCGALRRSALRCGAI
jgi:hypothetical protein